MSPIKLGLVDVHTCPLCGFKPSKAYDQGPDILTTEINRYLPASEAPLPALVNTRKQCETCGLIFLSPRLDDVSLSLLYERWYRYTYRRIFDDERHIAERLKEFERHHLMYLKKSCPTPGRLLDVGCGTGVFLHVARRAGWSVVGVEFDEHTACCGRERYDLEIRSGRLADVLHESERFNVITMFDYLEHSTEPGRDLDWAAAHLMPGGALMIRVPNMAGWQARMMKTQWLACISNHLAYFTPQVLLRALRQRGLTAQVVCAENYQSEWDIFKRQTRWCAQRLPHALPFMRKPNDRNDGGSMPPLQGGPLASVKRYLYSLFIEQVDHIGGWFGHGNNLLVVSQESRRA